MRESDFMEEKAQKHSSHKIQIKHTIPFIYLFFCNKIHVWALNISIDFDSQLIFGIEFIQIHWINILSTFLCLYLKLDHHGKVYTK